MDIAKALAELRAQRDDIDHAILSLERLISGRQRGRGRPPGRTLSRARKRPKAPSQSSTDRLKTTSD
jgi:hypothetical protein